MPRFFCEEFEKNNVISGKDALHISKSLRMKTGEELTVCDTKGTDYFCKIKSITKEEVLLEIISKSKNITEPTVNVTLFQCMPKSDKLDLITQKCVELGVNTVIPIISSRCISRPDKKSALNKTERLQKIAIEAAKQCGRGILPKVECPITYKECIALLKNFDTSVIFYELGGSPLKSIIKPESKNIAVIIGPEGGLNQDEVDIALSAGAKCATLGKRILRTETAPIAALANIMLLSGNMD